MARRKVGDGAEVPQTTIVTTAGAQPPMSNEDEVRAKLDAQAAASKDAMAKAALAAQQFADEAVKKAKAAELAKTGATLTAEMEKNAQRAKVLPIQHEVVPGREPTFAPGEPVEATWPEEQYGLKGSFSSYRVGPFHTKSRCQPGESRPQAIRRLMNELAEAAAFERIRARDAFLAHYEVAFTKG